MFKSLLSVLVGRGGSKFYTEVSETSHRSSSNSNLEERRGRRRCPEAGATGTPLAGCVAVVRGEWMYVCRHGCVEKQINRQEGRWVWQGGRGGVDGAGALGGEGKFDTAGGVALVAGHALQAAVVIQVAGAGRAYTVQLSMGELCAFHVHFNLLCSRAQRDGRRERVKGKRRKEN